jgi:mono/diheme cytochrome c family protein
MPASEKTWRDQMTLHVVFGCTGLLLLIATVWMLGADHTRAWKRYQRKMRNVDVRLTQWRMDAEQTRANAQRRDELSGVLAETATAPPPQAAFDQFVGSLQDEQTASQLREQYDRLNDEGTSESERQRLRKRLDGKMSELISLARFEEENLLSRRKFKSADYDERRANYDLAIRDGKPQEVLDELQQAIDQVRGERDELTLQYQAAADYRQRLDNAFRAMQAPSQEIQTQLADLEAEYQRLASTREERRATYFTSRPPFLGKRWLELPILDAFNSPLKIDNLWTENLTITNGSFGSVRRFDRCTTCHRAIDRTAPGSAVDPLYESSHVVELELPTPEERPGADSGAEGEGADTQPTLLSVYGISLANEGLIHADDVAIRQLLPNSLATQARVVSGDADDGLKVGDVLLYIRGSKVLSVDAARRYLLEQVEWGKPVNVRVLRGLPHPYSSHPRLDLFVGSQSPHPVSHFGCTVCHEGQGSATDFKWASHSPNSPEQEAQWVRDHEWFSNHHWIYPMFPARFAESSCLKCHHEVVELELAAANFDQPPAPKLMQGYHLIRQNGCFGCHEINGYNGPDNRIGPDLRLEPNYAAAAAQIKADPGFAELTDEQKSWVEQLIQHPERTPVRQELLRFLKADMGQEDQALLAASHAVIPALEDVETPGQLRKVGPSLRHLKHKVGETWLYDWLRDPTHFRASTRMPRFFGLWDHLDHDERATAERYEPIEILGIVRYLLHASQNLELLQPGDDAFAEDSDAQAERGKVLFETRGCLACHMHHDFPYATATQGPDLSNVGDKLSVADNPDEVRDWLYTWLKNPSLYHPRTKMPDLYLDPVVAEDGTTTDPGADIAVYLLNSSTEWSPKEDTQQFLEANPSDLDALLSEHLKTKLYTKDVERALQQGRIPDEVAARLEGAEAILTGEDGLSAENKLLYVGHKTITKYGCYGCHDVPGFETAKPIGTGLADWGRKDPARLAFEHIAEYLSHGHGHAHGAARAADQPAEAHAQSHAAANPASAASAEGPFDEEYYVDRLAEHDRTGFIWQKLKEPRSYDFAKARNKDSFNDRLRMPLFHLSNKEREAVITFVLGLVSEPPAYEFVYHPDNQKQALIAGHEALSKYNCFGCHIVDPETWTLEIPSGLFEEQPSDPTQTFPFMPHQFTSGEIEASAMPHPLRGTVIARLEGMPEISSDSGLPRVLDDEGDEIDLEEKDTYDPMTLIYPFELWRPTLIDGFAYQVGVVPLEVEAQWIRHHRPSLGGDLTKWLLPRVVELEKEANPQADGKQAYGWLPPPLLGQGEKVQTDWLHSFLLEPYAIRPSVFLRMPKFNMSPQEATDLVNYFAAKDKATYPYEYNEATQEKRLNETDAAYRARVAEANAPDDEQPRGDSRFDHAMNIVTSSDYCVQCHMVDDFVPKTSDRAMAPDLSSVHQRSRPDYLKRWLANPKQLLPYTPMPVNVKYNADAPNLGGVSQSLYHGTSLQQLEGLVDLLMNYPRYAKSRASVSELVPPAAVAGESAAEGEEGDEGDEAQ